MNKFISISIYLLVTLSCLKLTEAKQLTGLELKIDKLSYLIGDLITADVIINNLPDKNVTIEVKARSNKNPDTLLECIDCSPKIFITNQSVTDNASRDKEQRIQFKFKAIEASRLTLYIQTNLEKAELDRSKTIFIEFGIIKSNFWSILSNLIGWGYFIGWMVCYYPALENYRNKSCVGLNIDYCTLNFIGFLFYAVFNVSLYFLPMVQAEYDRQNPYSNIPVLINDVAFSVHHFLISFYIYLQCVFIYENGNQSYSNICIVSVTSVFSAFFVLGYYTLEKRFNLLDFVYYTGYVKMAGTACKFIPQAYSNFKRKSTTGFSTFYIYFDILGGVMCLLQMFVLIHNYQDWSFITQNIAKTGIALLCLLFDGIFLFQQFVLYKKDA